MHKTLSFNDILTLYITSYVYSFEEETL